MLVLTRTIGKTIVIDDNITIAVLDINGKHVTFGIEAPRELSIVRGENILKDKPND
jgi:carbon storage regulator